MALTQHPFEDEFRQVEAELARYAEAIATTGPVPAILDAIKIRQQRRTAIRAELALVDKTPPITRVSARDLTRQIMQRLTSWWALFEKHPIQARQTILRPLLTRRIPLMRRLENGARFYDFQAPISSGRLISGLVALPGSVTVVPPG